MTVYAKELLGAFLFAAVLMGLIVVACYAYSTYYIVPRAEARCAARGLSATYLGLAGFFCADPKTGAIYGSPRDNTTILLELPDGRDNPKGGEGNAR